MFDNMIYIEYIELKQIPARVKVIESRLVLCNIISWL